MASSSAHECDKCRWRNELPLGIRFRPTDEELLRDYLKLRFLKLPITSAGIISDEKVYNYPPELLQQRGCGHDDGRMYFFTYLERKDDSIRKAKRGVGDVGFWKATQAQAIIAKNHQKLGTKTPLSYYKYVLDKNGKKVGRKQNWLMQEYRLPDNNKLPDKELALCVIYYHEKRKKNLPS